MSIEFQLTQLVKSLIVLKKKYDMSNLSRLNTHELNLEKVTNSIIISLQGLLSSSSSSLRNYIIPHIIYLLSYDTFISNRVTHDNKP